jgi:replication factor C subunit 3/5
LASSVTAKIIDVFGTIVGAITPIVNFIKDLMTNDFFPHMIFYGPPGTGKTTTIINLINEYQMKYNRNNKSTVIHLNASDERGIDIIRNQILQFVRTKNFFDAGLKFVILD